MTKRTLLKDANDNLVGIRVETRKDTFTIPVADVRVNRERAEKILKAQNKSKYMKPTYSLMGYSYQSSSKLN